MIFNKIKKKGTNVILYLGFNSFSEHKRGVENVIAFQSEACYETTKIYLYFGNKNVIYRWNNLICISIKMNIIRFIVMNFIVWKLFKKYNKIIIHSHNYLMSFFLLKSINIMTVHDALFYQTKCLNRNFSSIFKFIEIVVYNKTNLVHFISKYSKSQSLLRSDKSFIVIPNTSHLESLVQSNDTGYSFPDFDEECLVFSVRSIEERAGIDLLIDVAEKHQLSESKLKFVVAGKGPMLEYYRNIIKLRGLRNIFLLGYISDIELVSYYRQCRIVLLIARYAEGFGLPIIEGYLFNKPVVASNVCAIPEVIIDNSFLFENKIDKVIEKITFGLKQVGSDYRKFYLDRFGNQNIISQFSYLYRSYLT